MSCTFVLEHRSEIMRRCLARARAEDPSLPPERMASPLNEVLDRMSGVGRSAPPATQAPMPPDDQVGLVGTVCDVVLELVAEHRWLTDSLIHEIRNALATATLASRLLREGSAPVHGHTSDILARSHHRMQSLVTFALGEIRLVAPDAPRHAEVRLAPLLDEIAEAAYPDREIQVNVEVVPSLVLRADEDLLASALENLVQNAIKFTRPGHAVAIRSWEADLVVIIEVEDRCGGLPAGRVEDLFRPYVQRGTNKSGVGLGLAIAKRAIEAHGGWIGARDLPGVGCVFRVELPASQPAPDRRPQGG